LFENTQNFGTGWGFARTFRTTGFIAPDGTNTAEKLIATSDSGTHIFTQVRASTLPATISIFAKAAEYFIFRINSNTSANGFAEFNLLTGTVSSTGGTGFVSASISDAGSGWYRCAVALSTETNESRTFVIQDESSSVTFTGDNTKGILFWGAQLEAGSTRTAYQRVTTAFDVTEAGQRDCFGVRADGTDDFYTTAAINFNTPKLTIFAAVRALTDVTRGVIGGTFVNAFTDFTLLEAPGATAGQYQFASRKGSSVASAQGAYTAPEYTVLTGESDRFLQRIRLNGVTTETRTDDTGTQNIGNVPLGLFHRITQNDRFFNGNLYALIVAGGSYPLSTIQRVERILSRITPTVNL
jgi:hypothetical protein